MTEEQTCGECKYSKDLKGCASHHAETALKLLNDGKVQEAKENLKGLHQHLKE